MGSCAEPCQAAAQQASSNGGVNTGLLFVVLASIAIVAALAFLSCKLCTSDSCEDSPGDIDCKPLEVEVLPPPPPPFSPPNPTVYIPPIRPYGCACSDPWRILFPPCRSPFSCGCANGTCYSYRGIPAGADAAAALVTPTEKLLAAAAAGVGAVLATEKSSSSGLYVHRRIESTSFKGTPILLR